VKHAGEHVFRHFVEGVKRALLKLQVAFSILRDFPDKPPNGILGNAELSFSAAFLAFGCVRVFFGEERSFAIFLG